uniref:WD repeat-containing protein 37 n=1 Tax=Panagrellus redivivus TaxID=6233 RepID=A0A7E4VJQ7_PANRE
MTSSSNRPRGQSDSVIATPVAEEATAPYKTKLYELFSLIEREFEALHNENARLRQRLETQQSNTGDAGGSMDSPSSNTVTIAAEDIFELARGPKKQSQMKSKWKSAFTRPPGRLVTSLKGGSSNSDSSKSRYVQNFNGHTDAVWDLASLTTPNVRIIASASADQTSRIWNADDTRCLLNYTGHCGSVNSVALYPDKTNDEVLCLTASGDRTVHLWKSSHLSNTVQPMASSEDDLDAASDKVEEAEDQVPNVPLVVRQPLLVFAGHTNAVSSADWLPDGDQILTASWDRTANIYDAENGKILNVLTGHDQELTHCNAHGCRRLVATASKDYTFRLWDFRDSIQSVAVFQGHDDSVTSVVFSSNHHIISGSDDRTVKVWDLRNMRCPISAARLDSAVNRLAVNLQQNLLAVPHDNRHIGVFDLRGMRAQSRLPRSNGRCHRRMVTAAAWLPDHETNNLISSSIDCTIIGWKIPVQKN